MSHLPEVIPGLIGVFSSIWAKKRPLRKGEVPPTLARAIDILPPEFRVWITQLLIEDGDELKEDLGKIIEGHSRREFQSTNEAVARFRQRIEQECQIAHRV